MITERIKKFRKGIGLSQEEFAQMVGVSRQTVIKWENGASQPSVQNTLKMSEVFCVSPKVFFDEEVDVNLAIAEHFKNSESNKKSDKVFNVKKVIWHTILVVCSAYMAYVVLCVGVYLIYLFAPIDNSDVQIEALLNFTPEGITYCVITGILAILSLGVIMRFLVVKGNKKRKNGK